MTLDQIAWLDEHPSFKRWYLQPIVTTKAWTDVGYLTPKGRFIADGWHYPCFWPLHIMSSGETLYIIPEDTIKVGREYDIM